MKVNKDCDILSAPLTVNWSLSYRCNFICRHCYSRNQAEAPLPRESVLRILDLLRERGVVYVNFGGGEPLLYPDLFEVVSHASSVGLKVAMNSNGYLLDASAVERIASAGFFSVGISIDSPRRDVHDRFRCRVGSFDRAAAALEHLRSAGVRTTVSCVINRGNVEDWEGMIPICRELGASTLYLHNYKCSGTGLVNMGELDLTPDEWGGFYRHAIEVQGEVEDVALSFDDPIMASLPGYKQENAVQGSTCGKLSLHLEPNGDITPCGFIPVVMGNILADDFDEIWFNSPVLAKMRYKNPQGKCDGCSSYESCLGGCSARSFSLTGDFEHPDPHCWVKGAGNGD